jgi:excisionase family DNA binding protein
VIAVGEGLAGRWYTITEAAAHMHVTVRTLERWAVRGHIAIRKAGRRRFVNALELAQAEQARRQARTRGYVNHG